MNITDLTNLITSNPTCVDTKDSDPSVPYGKSRYCGSVAPVPNLDGEHNVDGAQVVVTTDEGMTYVEVTK